MVKNLFSFGIIDSLPRDLCTLLLVIELFMKLEVTWRPLPSVMLNGYWFWFSAGSNNMVLF